MSEQHPSHNLAGADFLWLQDGAVANYKRPGLEATPEHSEFGYVEALRKAVAEIRSEKPDPEYLAALKRGREFIANNRDELSQQEVLSTGELKFEEVAQEYVFEPPVISAERKFVPPEIVEAYLAEVLEVYKLLDIAKAKEFAEGIDAATEAYETTLEKMKDIIRSKPEDIPDVGYKFDLIAARCQSRLGVSEATQPYQLSSISYPKLSERDRRADLRAYALQSIGIAIAKAGGKDAPHDVASLIMTQRSKMYMLYAAFDETHGNTKLAEEELIESVVNIRAAEDLLATTEEFTTVPDLSEIINEQRVELKAVGAL